MEFKSEEGKKDNTMETQLKKLTEERDLLLLENNKLKTECDQLRVSDRSSDIVLTEIEKLIENEALKLYKESESCGNVFVTLNQERDYWNSGDELHFFISKGRCKELPEEISDVLQSALNDGNKLLREATNKEIMDEMRFRAQEKLLNEGTIKPSKIKDNKLKL